MINYLEYLKTTEYLNLKYGDITTVTVDTPNGRSTTYACVPIAFDIETSKVYKDGVPYSFMYIWQMAINGVGIYGRTWEDLEVFLTTFKNEVIDQHQYKRNSKGGKRKCKVQFFGMIHNITYEWAFIRGNMTTHISNAFLKEKREPLYVDMCGIRFIDTYQITRMSLAKLAKTYCNTQKLTGDLDYNVVRSNQTQLTRDEFKYCENDVLILNEYQTFYIKTFLKNGIRTFIYTQTGIVRAQLKRSFERQMQISKDDIYNMYPPNRTLYDVYMTYLFRGGYVHGRADVYEQVLHHIDSFDITSAHPYQICSKRYPMERFDDTTDSLNNLNDDYAYILDITFKDIKAKANHSIESLSKCLEVSGVLTDNGRVYQAESMRVLLTEVDYAIYRMFYTWDVGATIVNHIKRSKKGYLPRYVVENVLNAYETKERLKLAKKPYMLEKIFLNSIYGSFVTQIEKSQMLFRDGQTEEKLTDYSAEVSKRILSPFWGIWTTAYTRYQQLSLLCELDGVYGDTDSNKCIHSQHNFDIVSAVNADIIRGNAVICKRYHKDFELIKELGQWDYEGTYERFKMLGAKRYVYELDGDVHITCAGLPKSVDIPDPFNTFKEGLSVKDCKLTTVYHDSEYTAIVDGVLMTSKSGVSLIPCSFTLSVSAEYADFVSWIQRKLKSFT